MKLQSTITLLTLAGHTEIVLLHTAHSVIHYGDGSCPPVDSTHSATDHTVGFVCY